MQYCELCKQYKDNVKVFPSPTGPVVFVCTVCIDSTQRKFNLMLRGDDHGRNNHKRATRDMVM